MKQHLRAALQALLVFCSMLFCSAALSLSPRVAVDMPSSAPDVDPEIATLYLGPLGDNVVQMALSIDPDDDEVLSGEYFVFGGQSKVLVVGELSGAEFYLEESQDGNKISGYWEGKFLTENGHGYMVGVWTNADERVKKNFKLERVLRTRSFVKRVS